MKKILIIAAAFAVCAFLEKPADHNLRVSASLTAQDNPAISCTPAAQSSADHGLCVLHEEKSPELQSL